MQFFLGGSIWSWTQHMCKTCPLIRRCCDLTKSLSNRVGSVARQKAKSSQFELAWNSSQHRIICKKTCIHNSERQICESWRKTMAAQGGPYSWQHQHATVAPPWEVMSMQQSLLIWVRNRIFSQIIRSISIYSKLIPKFPKFRQNLSRISSLPA